MNKRKRSKRKLTLKLLGYANNAKAKIKNWPRYETGFPALSVQLAHAVASAVLDNAWDASSVVDWSWDEYYEHFTFQVESVFPMGTPNNCRSVRMSSRFHIDPRKDLLEELDRVSSEVKAYSNDLLLMRRAWHAKEKT